jgi:hypothetical protein
MQRVTPNKPVETRKAATFGTYNDSNILDMFVP